MPQKLIYIHSITPGSLMDKCNKFKVGDEIVMAGDDLMVGLTWKAASDKINQLVGSFKIVAQRRETAVAKSEEKKQEVMNQNGSENKNNREKAKPLATIATNNSQLSTAASTAAQQNSEGTKTNKVTASVHSGSPIVPAKPINNDQSITFTVKVRIGLFNSFDLLSLISYSLIVQRTYH